MMQVALRSPYDEKIFVKLLVPHETTLSDLREAGRLGARALAAAKNESTLGDYPIHPSGALGLLLLSKCCHPEHEQAIMGIIGAYSFARQAEEISERRGSVDKARVTDSVAVFKAKYGPEFPKYAVQMLSAGRAPWREIIMRIIEQNA